MIGRIVNLAIGNTKVVADMIRELTGSDMFEIDTVKPYPHDYKETTNVAADEKRKSSRPKLSKVVDNMNLYGVIYPGYPNWWGTFPMAVFTFLESYDFSGKTIIPFCTHEGSGIGSSERDIKWLCPDAEVLPGLTIRGGSVAGAGSLVENWVKKLG